LLFRLFLDWMVAYRSPSRIWIRKPNIANRPALRSRADVGRAVAAGTDAGPRADRYKRWFHLTAMTRRKAVSYTGVECLAGLRWMNAEDNYGPPSN